MLRGEISTPAALGNALRQARLMRGLTQQRLADEIGVTQKWISQLEQGKPGLLTERLFEVLRATDARLVCEVDDEDNDG